MAKKYGRKSKVKGNNIWDYHYILNGQPGIGKTTFFMETFTKLLGLDGNCLLTIGKEPKAVSSDYFWTEDCATLEDLLDIVDEFYYNKSDYPDLKMVAIDSLDELFRLAEEYVIRKYNETVSDISKKAESIKKANGGYGEGEKAVKNEVIDALFKLEDVGIHLFFIGHTKSKAIKDEMLDIEYEIVTSSVYRPYYESIYNLVNISACAYFEREMIDVKTVKDQYTKKDKQRGRIGKEERIITFRDENFATDVKSHLKYIEPKCSFDSDTFIEVVNKAIADEKKYYDQFLMNVDTQSKDSITKEEENKTETEEKVETRPSRRQSKKKTRQEMLELISSHIGNIDQTKVIEIVEKNNIEAIEEASEEILEEIIALIPNE